MGGFNSGPGPTRDLVEECAAVRASDRDAVAAAGARLVAAPCRFGGRRWYLACPACDRRVAALYVPPRPGAGAACRHCHRLQYRSRRGWGKPLFPASLLARIRALG